MENIQKNIQKKQEENLPFGQQILNQLIQINKHLSSMDNNITTLNTKIERVDNNLTKLNTKIERIDKKQKEPKMQPKEDKKIEIKKEDETEEKKYS